MQDYQNERHFWTYLVKYFGMSAKIIFKICEWQIKDRHDFLGIAACWWNCENPDPQEPYRTCADKLHAVCCPPDYQKCLCPRASRHEASNIRISPNRIRANARHQSDSKWGKV